MSDVGGSKEFFHELVLAVLAHQRLAGIPHDGPEIEASVLTDPDTTIRVVAEYIENTQADQVSERAAEIIYHRRKSHDADLMSVLELLTGVAEDEERE